MKQIMQITKDNRVGKNKFSMNNANKSNERGD